LQAQGGCVLTVTSNAATRSKQSARALLPAYRGRVVAQLMLQWFANFFGF
jgi:hypothetical protein